MWGQLAVLDLFSFNNDWIGFQSELGREGLLPYLYAKQTLEEYNELII